MQLIGSVTSPFVRRIRLYLIDTEYDFLAINIFSDEGRLVLNDNNPAKKIPVLKDGDKTIFDSRIIFNYLNKKLNNPELTWQQENLLTLIDAANDSLVSMFICKNSALPVESDVLFFNLQRERVEAVLIALNEAAVNGDFANWQYPEVCLFCLLDWVEFRQLTPWRQHQGLVDFYQRAQTQKGVKETDPR